MERNLNSHAVPTLREVDDDPYLRLVATKEQNCLRCYYASRPLVNSISLQRIAHCRFFPPKISLFPTQNTSAPIHLQDIPVVTEHYICGQFRVAPPDSKLDGGY